MSEERTKLKTPEGQLSYPFLFESRAKMDAKEGDKPRFSTVIVFPEEADLSELKSLVLNKAKEKWGEKAGGMFRNKDLRTPFRKSDEKPEKGYPAGSTYINAWSTNRPGVVSIYPDPNNKGKPTIIPPEDSDKVYPGVFAKLLVSVFHYDQKGNKGVSFSLAGVQIIRDGERLDGAVAVQDAFDADQDAVADLSDLTGELAQGDVSNIRDDPLDDLL